MKFPMRCRVEFREESTAKIKIKLDLLAVDILTIYNYTTLQYSKLGVKMRKYYVLNKYIVL